MAARQHGLVSTRQLSEAGIGHSAVSRRIEAGRLHRIHRGVYAVGHARLSFDGRLMAAVLACGEMAAVSHHSAAALWQLLPLADGPVHISVAGASGRERRRGLRIHRRRSLAAGATTRHKGIPVTTPAQTLSDLRSVLAPPQWRRAIRQAEMMGFRTGVKERSAPTRSELEDRFLALCRRHDLPLPEINVRLGRYEVDFLWRTERVIVETDGYRYHRGSQAFEDDHDRDLTLRILGYDVRRFSYRQVTESPQRVAAAVRQALRQR